MYYYVFLFLYDNMVSEWNKLEERKKILISETVKRHIHIYLYIFKIY